MQNLSFQVDFYSRGTKWWSACLIQPSVYISVSSAGKEQKWWNCDPWETGLYWLCKFLTGCRYTVKSKNGLFVPNWGWTAIVSARWFPFSITKLASGRLCPEQHLVWSETCHIQESFATGLTSAHPKGSSLLPGLQSTAESLKFYISGRWAY